MCWHDERDSVYTEFGMISEEWSKNEKITFNLTQKQLKTHKEKDSEMERWREKSLFRKLLNWIDIGKNNIDCWIDEINYLKKLLNWIVFQKKIIVIQLMLSIWCDTHNHQRLVEGTTLWKTEFGKVRVGYLTANLNFYGKITSNLNFTHLTHAAKKAGITA